MKKLHLLTVVIFFACSGFGQMISSSTETSTQFNVPDNHLLLCRQDTFRYNINTSLPDTVTGTITLHLPYGISYNSILSSSVPISHISSPDTVPQFDVKPLSANFTFQLILNTPSCETTPPYVDQFTKISGPLFSNSYIFNDTLTWSKPVLTVTDITAMHENNVGGTGELIYIITNDGYMNSEIDSLFFSNAFPTSLNSYNEKYYFLLKDSLHNLPIHQKIYNSYTYKLEAGKTLYSLQPVNKISNKTIDSLLGHPYIGIGDTILLFLPYRKLNCNEKDTDIIKFYTLCGLTDSTCNLTILNTYINIPSCIRPYMDIVLDTPFVNASYCGASNDTLKLNYTLRNNIKPFDVIDTCNDTVTASEQADSIRIIIWTRENAGTLDTASVKINGYRITNKYESSYNTGGSCPGDYWIIDMTRFPAGLKGDTLGINTLCDLSGNGKACDLAEGDTFHLSFHFVLANGCPPLSGNNTSCNPVPFPSVYYTCGSQCSSCDSFSWYVDYQNTISGEGPNYDVHSYQSEDSVPLDVRPGGRYPMKICPEFSQQWFPQGFSFCPGGGYYQISVHLPPNFYLDSADHTLLTNTNLGYVYNVSSYIYSYNPVYTIYNCKSISESIAAPTMQEFYQKAYPRYDSVIIINFGTLPLTNCNNSTVAPAMSCITVPFQLNCDSLYPTLLPQNLDFTLNYVCNPSSPPCDTCLETLASGNATTTKHCSGMCATYVVPGTSDILSIFRTNLGYYNLQYPDYYAPCNDTASQVIPAMSDTVTDLAFINTGDAYPGDQVQLNTIGSYSGLIDSMESNCFLEVFIKNMSGFPASHKLFTLDPDSSSYFIITGFTDPLLLRTIDGEKITLPSNALTYRFANTDSLLMDFSIYKALKETLSAAAYDTFATYGKLQALGIISCIHLRVLNNLDYKHNTLLEPGNYTFAMRCQYMMKDSMNKDTISSCDSWGLYFDLLQPDPVISISSASYDPQFNTGDGLSVCTPYQFTFTFADGGGYLNSNDIRDDFPLEFRPFAKLGDTVTFIIPRGYKPDSCGFYIYLDNYNVSKENYFNGGSYQQYITIKPFYQSPFNPTMPDTIIFIGLDTSCFPYFDQKIIPPPFEAFATQLNINVYTQPYCTALPNDTFKCHAVVYSGTQQQDTRFQTRLDSTYRNLIVHENPALTFYGPNTPDLYNNTLTFVYYISSKDYRANDVWIAFQDTLRNRYIFQSPFTTLHDYNYNKFYTPHLYNNNSGVVFNLGYFPADTKDSLYFTVPLSDSSISCPHDTHSIGYINVIYGVDCGSDSVTSSPNSTCSQGNILQSYNIYPSFITMLLDSNDVPLSLCSGQLVEDLTMQVVGSGNINDPQLMITYPAGLTPDSIRFYYPCPGGWDTLLYNADSTAYMVPVVKGMSIAPAPEMAQIYNLDKDLKVRNLPGSIKPPDSIVPGSQLCIRAYFTPNCDYSGGNITFYGKGVTVCNDTLLVPVVTKPGNIISSCCPCMPEKPIINGEEYACHTLHDSAFYYWVSDSENISAYSWTTVYGFPASGINAMAHVWFNPLVGGSITFTATHIKGVDTCRQSTTFYVKSCCAAGPFDTILYNANADTNYVFIQKNILIQGTYSTYKPITFAGCDVQFTPYASINILNNSSLTIEALPTISNTYLHAACDTMWRGIFINPGAYLYVEPLTLIEDADSAVVALNSGRTQGIYECIGKKDSLTIFNKNYKNLVVTPTTVPYKGYADSCVFTCRALPPIPPYNWVTFSPASLLVPHSTIPYSYNGMEFRYVDSVTERGANVFDNMMYGIESFSSNLKVYCDTFKNIIATTYSPITFCAIYARGSAPDTFALTVGDSLKPNKFYNCNTGVYAKAHINNISINFNTFRNSVLVTGYYGVHISEMDTLPAPLAKQSTLDVEADTIINLYNGIESDMNGVVNGTINYNTIEESGCNSLEYNGIVLNEMNSVNATYTIEENNITVLNAGVYANGIKGGTTIALNKITLKRDSTDTCLHSRYYGGGIKLVNYFNAQISCNLIHAPSFRNSTTGIIENGSELDSIISNTIDSANIHIRFHGPMFVGDNLWDNQLTYGRTGILADDDALTGGYSLGAPNDASDNNFMTITCQLNVPIGITYYHFLPPPANCTFFSASHTNTGYNPCPLPPLPPKANKKRIAIHHFIKDSLKALDSASILMMEEIIGSKFKFQILRDTNMIIAKEGVLDLLWKNSYLLSDSIFHAFNDSMSQAPMGEILMIDTTINSIVTHPNFIKLLTSLNAITPNNNIESNIQTAIQGFLYYRINDSLPLNELTAMRTVAHKCPDWDGNGVFMARALLSLFDSVGTVYSDTCSNENIGKEVKSPKKQEINNSFNLYPNPNNGVFTLSYSLQKGQIGMFIIYNLLGQDIQEDELNPSLQTMNITANTISNGIYLYEIIVNGSPIKKDKLIIIK